MSLGIISRWHRSVNKQNDLEIDLKSHDLSKSSYKLSKANFTSSGMHIKTAPQESTLHIFLFLSVVSFLHTELGCFDSTQAHNAMCVKRFQWRQWRAKENKSMEKCFFIHGLSLFTAVLFHRPTVCVRFRFFSDVNHRKSLLILTSFLQYFVKFSSRLKLHKLAIHRHWLRL